MTVKEIFDLRKQGKVEEAYEAIRPMYRMHKGYYTSLCMYHCAKDVFYIRLAEGRIQEAEKIYQALQNLVPFIGDKDGTVSKFMSEAGARLNALSGHNNLAQGLAPGGVASASIPPCKGNITQPRGLPLGISPEKNYSPPREEGLGVEENKKVVRLLSVLKGEMSVREMMAALGFGSRDKFLKNYLSPALKSGLIEMTQPDTPKSPTQKYRRAQGDI